MSIKTNHMQGPSEDTRKLTIQKAKLIFGSLRGYQKLTGKGLKEHKKGEGEKGRNA